MKEEIIKPGVVRKIVEKLDDKRIIVGGNKEFYKSKYHLQYTQEIVDNVVSAFLQVMTDEIADGNVIKLNGYFTIAPKYKEARKGRNVYTNEEIDIPAKYKLKVKTGSKFEEACKRLTEKVIGGEEDNQD
ncbi:MAG: HU family DNA-binding protein [Lachnospiraceae bacterium]|nr:HU family DNA-binding protein [Lachnospiraceae bacterium]